MRPSAVNAAGGARVTDADGMRHDYPTMRVLLLVPGRLVETLQASGLIRTLGAAAAQVEVTVACAPMALDVARALEGVQEVLPLQALDPSASPLAWVAAWAAVRRARFEAAVVCGHSPAARLLAYLAGIPLRSGPGGGLSAGLLSERIDDDRRTNRAAVWVACADRLGAAAPHLAPRLDPGAEAGERALVELHRSGIADGRLLVALVPGTSHADVAGLPASATAWPAERWAHLANLLASRHGAGILFVGTPGDEAAVAAVAMDVDAPCADLTGQLDGPLTFAALLHHCNLVVSGDSPVLHLAAAVGTPTLGLFGPTDGRRRGPYGEEHRVVQALSGRPHRARRPPMEQIRVEDALAAIESSF
jgi:heptosyltransferase-3